MTNEKKYKEALEKAREFINQVGTHNLKVDSLLEQIFPELAESEDEKIRKGLLALLKELVELGGIAQDTWSLKECKQYISWLEKQGEQKPAWSEEDERILNKIQDHLREFYVDKKGYPYVAEPDSPEVMENNWLMCIKNRVQPQPKQEWSE